jgi:hypothetical protein
MYRIAALFLATLRISWGSLLDPLQLSGGRFLKRDDGSFRLRVSGRQT